MRDPVDDLPQSIQAIVRCILENQVTGGSARFQQSPEQSRDRSGRAGQRKISRILQDAGVCKSDPRWKATIKYGRKLYYGKVIVAPRSQATATAVIASVANGNACAGTALPRALTRSASPVVRREAPPIRPGHRRSIDLLENTSAVRETLAIYERLTGHPVYLRPTNKGLTVMSLDPSTPAMVGVGGKGDCCINALPPTRLELDAAVRAFRIKVESMRRESIEERYVIARIRAALASRLELRDDLLFLHQEWRFSSADKIDILALDLGTGGLVVIEVKDSEAAALHKRDSKGRTAVEQASEYIAQLTAHASEYVPFFQRLASAMERIYRDDRVSMRVDPTRLPRWEVWWPDGMLAQPGEAIVTPDIADICFVSTDTSWQRELRRRQSRWRERQGYPIGSHNGRPLGSRLAMPAAEEKLWNFITPEIGELVRCEYVANASRSRTQKKVYGYPRLFEDLLSSQPLVFNLFGELALDLKRATTLTRRLWPSRVETVTRIEIEWSPGRWDPRYLDNGTAADIAFFHTTPNGGDGVICVEVKYHEDLRGKDYAVKPRYLEVARSSRAFLDDALPVLGRGPLQQLWFDHLLALAVRETGRLETSLFVVIHPEINEACSSAIAAYRRALSPQGIASFDARTIEALFPFIRDLVGDEWSRAFSARYLTPSDSSS
jgi:hypothetical protein